MTRKAALQRLIRVFQVIFVTGLVASLVVGIYYFSDINQNPVEQSVAIATSSSSLEATAASGCPQAQNVPVDNPIAQKYGTDVFPWTENIKWNCTYNIQDFPGATTSDRFQAARDAAVANGGGIIYFPAGTYTFSENLKLADGVVIRGETPTVTDAKLVNYNPPTKFIFPQYQPSHSSNGTPNDTAFKKIVSTTPNTDSNLGIVNIDINRAAIHFIGDVNQGTNKNIVVFGVRSNNVAEPDPQVPDLTFQSPWLRYSYRFAANIKVVALENVLVANNRLNDAITDNYEQPGYQVKPVKGEEIITYSQGDRVPFDYGNHYGIVVNRSGEFDNGETPATQPGLFRQGIAIQDNWIYHTMRVAIHASGQKLSIQNNQITDKRNKQWWTDPTGIRQPRGAVTYENRAIDWSGWDVKIAGNQYEVYRHQVMDSKYLSVDGEGILIQECCGGTTVNGADIRNNQGNSYIGFFKVAEIKNVNISQNQLSANVTNTPLIYVNGDPNNRTGAIANVRVEKNTVSGSILVRAAEDTRGNEIKNNVGNNSGYLEFSCQVAVSDNVGFDRKPCVQSIQSKR